MFYNEAQNRSRREREVRVGTLMMRCPNTGMDVPTGIETDRLSFERTPNFTSLIRCPICAEDHTWSKVDAWVAELELEEGGGPVTAGPPDPTVIDVAKGQSLSEPGLLETAGPSSSTAGTA